MACPTPALQNRLCTHHHSHRKHQDSKAVQAELEARTEETDKLRHRVVERAQYETDLARRRFLQVDTGRPSGLEE